MSSKNQLSLRSLFVVTSLVAAGLGIAALLDWDMVYLTQGAVYLGFAILQFAVIMAVALGMFFLGMKVGATALDAQSKWWQRPLAGAGSLTLIWFGCGLLYFYLTAWLSRLSL